MILSHSPMRGEATARVVPIDTPSRGVLHYRIQLAKSVLGHRPLTPETAALLLRILDGAGIDDLARPGQVS